MPLSLWSGVEVLPLASSYLGRKLMAFPVVRLFDEALVFIGVEMIAFFSFEAKFA